ncbi:hypothetical protein ASC82_17785 [Streptomyces sp. Root431]|uniref:HAD family hydrolase n=1 Tax=Streptomyces sp. Root431 TaxID=1736535 RepID=UPI0006F7D5CA|nr:HAD family hydrolase [Streptomyces sp. Root431]KQX11717.1 hypothetical protein ASC82_17785 [Streptomyces sp. Root431]
MSLVARRLATTEAVVFDFYGTLVEHDTEFPAMWEFLNSLGYRSHPELESAFEPNAFDGCLTPTVAEDPDHQSWLEGNWRHFLRLSGVPEDDVDHVLKQLQDFQATYRPRAVACANDLIGVVRERGRKVGLCSNWETPIQPCLDEAGLPPFDAVTVSAEEGARKPHGLLFDRVAAELGVAADRIAFVGDTWSADVVGALRAGMSPVWIRGGRASRGLPDLVAEFDTLGDFHRYIRDSL